MTKLRHLSNHPRVLKIMYYAWVAFPYPIRKPLTAWLLIWVLIFKKLARVDGRNDPTPMKDLGNLSFWGVPDVDIEDYSLEITGLVDNPQRLSLAELEGMATVERPVRMDCVGGFRNNATMKGVTLATLFETAQVSQKAVAAAFRCADGYYTTHLIADLLENDAFVAYELNEMRIDRFGHPLRLVAPGAYGYKWAKWVIQIELLGDFPKGYWESKGLPKRGRVGEIW
ncbi:MAG: molybdopterin-dependent oxidoreductase [Chloroflexi bacterium]|nr:molybdopterin-dependent oxidoreductase [Chloroflexota bacterium]